MGPGQWGVIITQLSAAPGLFHVGLLPPSCLPPSPFSLIFILFLPLSTQKLVVKNQ